MHILTLNVCNSSVISSYTHTWLMLMTLVLKTKKRKLRTSTYRCIWYVFSFPGLKLNKEKCETAGIGIKKGIKVAFCRMQGID